MKKKSLFTLVLGVLLLSGFVFAPASAQTQPQSAKKNSAAPLKGKSYYSYNKGQRRGSYSYKYAQGINARKFTDPTLNGQNAFGPLDGDFFFLTPRPPFGGETPYMH